MASKTKRLRVLQEIYATLPTVACKGLCYEACSAIPVTDTEQLALREAAPNVEVPLLPGIEVPPPATAIMGKSWTDPTCPYLVLRQCSAYAARPLICRLFGVADGLSCPHGCTPTRTITHEEVATLQHKLGKL